MTLAVKVSEPTAAAIDLARGGLSRSAWLASVISAALGIPAAAMPAAVATRGKPPAESEAKPVAAVKPRRFACCGHCRHGANITWHADRCSQCRAA